MLSYFKMSETEKFYRPIEMTSTTHNGFIYQTPFLITLFHYPNKEPNK